MQPFWNKGYMEWPTSAAGMWRLSARSAELSASECLDDGRTAVGMSYVCRARTEWALAATFALAWLLERDDG